MLWLELYESLKCCLNVANLLLMPITLWYLNCSFNVEAVLSVLKAKIVESKIAEVSNGVLVHQLSEIQRKGIDLVKYTGNVVEH